MKLDENHKLLELFLRFARSSMAAHDHDAAELLLLRALKLAIAEMPDQGTAEGLVLVELWDLYQRTGRDKQADESWRRLCSILQKLEIIRSG